MGCSHLDAAPVLGLAIRWRHILAAPLLLLLPGLAAAQPGAISGTVLGAGSTPLQNAEIRIYTSTEILAAPTVFTNAAGAYTVGALAPGTYYAHVHTGNVTGGGGHVDQLYPSTPCIGVAQPTGAYCRINAGGTIVVTAGTTTPNVNFDVGVGGSIAGTVTASGTPYSSTLVQLHANLGGAETRLMLAVGTNAAGGYTMNRLPPGSYFVWAGNVSGGPTGGHVGEAFNNVTCPHTPFPTGGGAPCTTAAATPLVVTSGGALTADFDLAAGGEISGTVTSLGTPVSIVRVRIYSTAGHLVREALSSLGTGAYTAPGLPAGQYRLATLNTLGLEDEVFNNIPCGADCTSELSTGALVTVTGGAVTPGVNFDLAAHAPYIQQPPAAQSVITGQPATLSVTAAGATPLSYQWYVGPSGNTTSPIGGATSSFYTTPALTVTTNYWVRVSNAYGTADSGTYTLTVGPPSITGTVMSGATPLQSAMVTIYRGNEQVAANVNTNAAGAYQVVPLPPGTYYAYVYTGNVTGGGYVDQLYPSTPCIGAAQSSGTYCRISLGAPILVTGGGTTPNINFNVGIGGSISGTVTASSTPYAGTQVQLHANLGGSETRTMLSVTTNGAGLYTMTRLPPGTYFVWAGNVPGGAATGYIGEAFNNLTCPHAPIPTGGSAPCRTATATPLVVTAGGSLTGTNIDLAPGGQIKGTVTRLGTPIAEGRVRIYSAAGHLARETVTSSGDYFALGLPAGAYRLATLNTLGLEDEVYDNIPCGADCTSELSSGALVTVTVGVVTSEVNFDLAPAPDPPTILVHPLGRTILAGHSTTLSVIVSDPPPLSYQWYVGSSGTTTTPIAGATSSSYTTPALTAPADYWVRVSNTFGADDSATATIVIVNPAQVITHPASQTIASGATATLNVTASGTAPLAYQWYSGASGNTAAPIGGATASSFTTPALTAAANFWVRVSNTFGSADSNTAAIAIGAAPSITIQPLDLSIPQGTAATLSVVAMGTAPLAYQWYEGETGATTLPMGGATGSTWTTPVLTESKRYWVRVSNAFGSVNSSAAGVTVIPPVGRPFDLHVRTIDGALRTFAWTAGVGLEPATSYVIEGGVPGSDAVLATIATAGPATMHSVEVPDGVYWVQVRAVAGVAIGESSERITICVNAGCPALSPENLLGTANGANLLLAWATPLENGWPEIVRLLVTGTLTASLDLAGTSQTFSYAGVPPGSYQFAVAACNGAVCSAPSNLVPLGFPAACSGPPEVPANFVANKAGSTITLNWDLPSAGPAPANFQVIVTGSFAGSFTVDARTLSGTVGPGSYTIRVAAANACGAGPATAPLTVTVP